MICENCNNEYDIVYGSGRFCCAKCARGFSTKAKRKEINEKVSKKLKVDLGTSICEYCGCEFSKNEKLQKACSRLCGSLLGAKTCNEKSKDPIKWSIIQKLSYKNGRNIVGGYTKWYDYNGIKVQGTFEFRTCKILDEWKRISKIKDWEYTKDRIPYIGIDGEEHTYHIDFKVYENDGRFYYIETKGFAVDNDYLKWQAVNDLGFKLEVWFKNNIIKHELELKTDNTL